ncbi:DUF4249 domain-containing protein [Sinomicrobium kalidii]|uniref:DUF4249 domain-containing protein n=1 Tax=Sinomicrobium kalidii TaxID=2900738 RepID=UPI001E583B6A|nr:DUF4249 domain-containing protein [Sinomicrobium kalidii]UGU16155.1 DUF4249 domain-containing protein [Sinomicrobium kalidii]
MASFKYIFLFTALACLVSCEDVVDIDLDTDEPRLVIDAGIEWVKGTDGSRQTVKLSTTTGYYTSDIPPVSGAGVNVVNSSGTVFNFRENPGTGLYVCTDFEPVIGETYELTVTVDGQTYTAGEKLMSVPEITRIEQDIAAGFQEDEIEVTFYYQDNPEEDNHYMARFEADVLVYPEYDIDDDRFTQGNEMFESFSHEDLEVGDRVDIRLSGISERFDNYMSLVLDAADSDPFGTPPANVRGNIINTTNETDYAYGYFRLSEVDTTSYVVK